MPEETVEQINNKLKCFVAEKIDLEDEICRCSSQISINREHMKRLFKKIRDILQGETGELGNS